MLTYTKNGARTEVRLENKLIGYIDATKDGYQYTPKGKKAGSSWSGEVMPSEALVRRSLESD